jgi:hypothetical protein
MTGEEVAMWDITHRALGSPEVGLRYKQFMSLNFMLIFLDKWLIFGLHLDHINAVIKFVSVETSV